MADQHPFLESPDISSARLYKLFQLFNSVPLGRKILNSLQSELNSTNVTITFDSTLSPESSIGLYYRSSAVIALNGHASDHNLTTVLAHEAAHHHQHQHGLLDRPMLATMRHIIKNNLRDHDSIRRAILTHALPYARMTEFDAFGRQAIYANDYVMESNNTSAIFDFYTRHRLVDRLTLLIRAFRALPAAEQVNPAAIYLCGFNTLSPASKNTYDLQHIKGFFYPLRAKSINWQQAIEDESLDKMLKSHPVDYYARQLDDNIAWSVAQSEKTVAALDAALYDAFPLSAVLELEELVQHIHTLAVDYDHAQTPEIKVHQILPHQNPYRLTRSQAP